MREGFRVLHRRVATWAPFSVSGACPSEQYLQADLQSGHIGIQQEIALSCIRPFPFISGAVSHEKIPARQFEMRCYRETPSQSYSGFIVPGLSSIRIAEGYISLCFGKQSPPRTAQVAVSHKWCGYDERKVARLEGHPESGCPSLVELVTYSRRDAGIRFRRDIGSGMPVTGRKFYQKPSVILFPLFRMYPGRKCQCQEDDQYFFS